MASIKKLTDRKFKITISNGYRPSGKKICKAKTITVPDSVKSRGIPQYVAHEAEELERLVDADFNFHYKLVKMSRNSLYKDVYYMVQQLIRQHISKLVYIRTHEAGWAPQEQHDTHLKVFNSIVNADPDAARQANREMLGIVPIAGVEEKVPIDW